MTDSHAHRVARAVMLLRTIYAEPVRIEPLEEAASMGLSAFHVHFRAISIKPYYDRSALMERTIHTVAHKLVEGAALVVVVLLVLLGSIRAGLLVAVAIPLSMLMAFVGMRVLGLSGNLMSLGAIDFGLIVDGSVVMIENVLRARRRRIEALSEIADISRSTWVIRAKIASI